MASPISAGDVLAIAKLCKQLADYIAQVKKASEEFGDAVLVLCTLASTFTSLSEDFHRTLSSDTGCLVEPRTGSDWGISKELTRSKKSLAKAAEILTQRYAEKRKLQRMLWWPKTRRDFEQCLKDVMNSLQLMTALLVSRNTSLTHSLRRSDLTTIIEKCSRPTPIGFPESGGHPRDHIWFENGLGQSMALIMTLCSQPERLHEYFGLMYRDHPGERRITKGHYKLYFSNLQELQEITPKNWHPYTQAGARISLAFVVGTWQLSCMNYCPGCNRRDLAEWNEWRNCRCGLRLLLSESGDLDYEPIDGWWDGRSNTDFDWRAQTRELLSDRIQGQTKTANDAGPQQDPEMKPGEEELYFRSMVLVYDPIFNYVCRNVFCRCILGATSVTSKAPRIEFLTIHHCPKHAPPWVLPNFDIVLRKQLDYDGDPYFEDFGGYQDFLRLAYWANQYAPARYFINTKSLLAIDHAVEVELEALSKTQRAALEQYKGETLIRMRRWWASYVESVKSVSATDALCIQQRLDHDCEDLAVEFDEAELSDMPITCSRDVGDIMVPVLWKGRVTNETLARFDANQHWALACG